MGKSPNCNFIVIYVYLLLIFYSNNFILAFNKFYLRTMPLLYVQQPSTLLAEFQQIRQKSLYFINIIQNLMIK